MQRLPIELDFVPRRSIAKIVGVALTTLGLAALAATAADYRIATQKAAAIEQARVARERSEKKAMQGAATRSVDGSKDIDAMRKALMAPWSGLLGELEAATAKSAEVAILSIEPDAAKRIVRIAGEASSLPAALEFVETLQDSAALKYPMLEEHEVRDKDPQRPVRFRIVAEWRVGA